MSPDLTVKSAATPDFLLENLPETFIDWKDPEATSTRNSPGSCGAPLQDADISTCTPVLSKDRSNSSSSKEEEKSDILTEHCQDKSSNNPTSPQQNNSQNKVSCAATPSSSNCTSAPHLEWTAGGQQEGPAQQQENPGEADSPTTKEQNQKGVVEGEGECLGEEERVGEGLSPAGQLEKAATPAREGSPIKDFISSVDHQPPTKVYIIQLSLYFSALKFKQKFSEL